MDCVKVAIPQYFDFKLYGIKKDSELSFLEKMCAESENKPIIQHDEPIGMIISSRINETNDGIVSEGIIWCNIKQELSSVNNSYSFNSTIIKNRFE